MPIVIACEHCGAQGEVSRSAAGLDVQCTGCGKPIHVAVGSGHLTVEWGVGVTGTRVLLRPGSEVRIGRASDNDLELPSERVSRHHAVLRFEEGEWHLHDLGSANGTLVDGHPVKDHVLSDRTTFQIGGFSIRVSLALKPRAEPLPPSALDELAAQESGVGLRAAGALRPVRPSSVASTTATPPRVDSKADTMVNGIPAIEDPSRASDVAARRGGRVTPPPESTRAVLYFVIVALLAAIGLLTWLLT